MRPKLLAFLVVFLTTQVSLAQSTILVPSQAATTQKATNIAVSGDTIEVAPGVYYENINFGGKDIVIVGKNGPQQTTIEGTFANSIVSFGLTETRAARLEGFRLRDGFGTGVLQSTGTTYVGGGLFIRAGSAPTIRNCIIQTCTAAIGGGAYCEGNARFESCTFESNHSWDGGGAIAISSGAQDEVEG